MNKIYKIYISVESRGSENKKKVFISEIRPIRAKL